MEEWAARNARTECTGVSVQHQSGSVAPSPAPGPEQLFPPATLD
ncbi:MAG: hypothetical protein ACPIOQ_36915 [Promethearchaeia archaeon]